MIKVHYSKRRNKCKSYKTIYRLKSFQIYVMGLRNDGDGSK